MKIQRCVILLTSIPVHRFTADHALPDNQLAQDAILLTFYHWGLHAWGIYTIVGLLLGLMAHRHALVSSSQL